MLEKDDNDVSGPCEISSDNEEVLFQIGKLRYNCWEGEGALDVSLFPDEIWVDDMDRGPLARHWVVTHLRTNSIVGAARLTWHASVEDDYRDVKLWREKGLKLYAPVIDFGRLVVQQDFRRRGIARSLVVARIQAAKEWCHNNQKAKTCVCTASKANLKMLQELGFVDIGQTAIFADRPRTVFHALQLDL